MLTGVIDGFVYRSFIIVNPSLAIRVILSHLIPNLVLIELIERTVYCEINRA